MICPVCKSSSTNSYGERYDDRYAYRGTFQLLMCANCGHGFLEAGFLTEELQHLYSNYYPRSSFNMESHRPYMELQGFNAWLNGEKSSTFRWVPRDVRVLDIGCGFGESLGYYQERGCDAYGVEADENIRRVADKFGYKVHVGLFDPKVYQSGFFDYVTMSQVIEHVTDPIQTMRGIAKVLKPGGLAIFSTPNANGWGAKIFGKFWINWHAPYHLQFFTKRSMQLAAEEAGLILEKTLTVTPSAWLHYQWIHLFTCPNPGEVSVFWTPGHSWSLRHRVMLKIFAIIHRSKIDHVITRCFDALGLGDNRLYFLRKP